MRPQRVHCAGDPPPVDATTSRRAPGKRWCALPRAKPWRFRSPVPDGRPRFTYSRRWAAAPNPPKLFALCCVIVMPARQAVLRHLRHLVGQFRREFRAGKHRAGALRRLRPARRPHSALRRCQARRQRTRRHRHVSARPVGGEAWHTSNLYLAALLPAEAGEPTPSEETAPAIKSQSNPRYEDSCQPSGASRSIYGSVTALRESCQSAGASPHIETRRDGNKILEGGGRFYLQSCLKSSCIKSSSEN
jgi:hypothetical protein